MGGWVGPRVGLDISEKEKKCPGPIGNQNSDCPAYSQVRGRGIHLHLVLSLGMSGAVAVLPIYTYTR